VTSARVTGDGFSVNGAAPSWGRFAAAEDPLVAAVRSFVGDRNPRLPRLDRQTLCALVAAHLVLDGGAASAELVVAVEEGSAAADRAYWATARERDGADASPTLFAATLPSAVAGELAMTFELRGPCVVFAGGGAFEAPRGRFAGGGPRLHVRLRGWGAGEVGEAVADLESSS